MKNALKEERYEYNVLCGNITHYCPLYLPH